MPASITLMCEIEMHMRKGEKIAPFMCAYKHIDIKRFALWPYLPISENIYKIPCAGKFILPNR